MMGHSDLNGRVWKALSVALSAMTKKEHEASERTSAAIIRQSRQLRGYPDCCYYVQYIFVPPVKSEV